MKNFITTNFKTILNVLFYGIILYWILMILTPGLKSSNEYKQKLNALDSNIKIFERRNLILDSQINQITNEIQKVDSSILNIKQQKTIIKEFYHEKIISVDNYGHTKLDSFFSKRYKH